ncbi:MAG: DUF1569 domain-containing protein [Chitinophagales bacterium]|nr:DUF1569 domain-containing protein [Chitinophagales bacterium]
MNYSSLLSRIENALPEANKSNTAVSARGVDWHLEHSLKIINSICSTLLHSDPKNYKPKFTIGKWYILLRGSIPRGRARSPKAFNNPEKIDLELLPVLLAKAKEKLAAIEKLDPNAHFAHPLFGDLNLAQAKKFIVIHTQHHLQIVDDILK